MKKNDIILIVSTLLFTFLLYKEGAGINYFLFSIGLCAYAGISKPELINNKIWLFAAVLTLIGGLSIFLNATILSLVAWYMAASYLAGVSASNNATPGTAISYATFSYITSIGFMISDMVQRMNRRDKARKRKINWSAVFTMTIFILVVVLVFFFVYQKANPLFKEITKFINLDFLNIQWVLFTSWGFLMMYGFLYTRIVGKIDKYETIAPQLIDQEICQSKPNRFLWFTMDENIELKSGIVLFLLLNIMILTINVLDISYLWSGVKLPEGFTFAGYLHQGIYTLMFSCLLAILLILFVFRGKLNFIRGNKTLKIMAYAWIAQNIIITLSCAYRNYIYISSYALTYKRITIFILLLLVVSGLITAFLKIRQSKNFYFLYRFNSFVVIAVLVITSLFSWDKIITRYNLQNSKFPDIEYLASLNHAGLPLLLEYIEETSMQEAHHSPQSLFSDNYFWFSKTSEEKIYDKAYDMLRRYQQKGWRSYNYSISTTINSINKKYSEGTLNRFVLRNKDEFDLSVLVRFNELRALTLSNNLSFKSFDLSPLYSFPKLRELSLVGMKINSLEKLPEFNNLTSIDLSDNGITDFNKLTNYSNLSHISIKNNPTSDISFLKELPGIKSLDISQTKVKDLTPIGHLKQIERLYLSGMDDPDFSGLPLLTTLVELDMSYNSQLHLYNNIPQVISNAPNLEKVYLRNASIGSLTFFSEGTVQIRRRIMVAGSGIDAQILGRIKLLDIAENNLTSLAGLQNFDDIQVLNASGNKIKNISHINSSPQIVELYLFNNPINSLPEIKPLKSLKSLHFSRFDFKDIDALSSLESLEALTLSNGVINNTETLQGLKNLKYLDLSGTMIPSLDFLKNMTSLEMLDISSYSGSDIEKVLQCPTLKVIIIPSTERRLIRQIREEIPQIRIIIDYDYNERDYYLAKYGKFV